MYLGKSLITFKKSEHSIREYCAFHSFINLYRYQRYFGKLRTERYKNKLANSAFENQGMVLSPHPHDIHPQTKNNPA